MTRKFAWYLYITLALCPTIAKTESTLTVGDRGATIRREYIRVRTGMDQAEVEQLLGTPDETLPLYEPKIKNPKLIGKTAWYFLSRINPSKNGPVVRVSFDLAGKVISIDNWGFTGPDNNQRDTDSAPAQSSGDLNSEVGAELVR